MNMKSKAALVFAAAACLGLGIQTAPAQPVLYWDINGPNPGGTDDEGGLAPGDWDTVTSNWTTDADGLIETITWMDGSIATFSAGDNVTGATSTITVIGNHTIAGLDFQEGRITISSGAGTSLILSGSPAFNVSSPMQATIFTPITGAARLTKTGPGLLYLVGAKTYTGGVTIDGGTLMIHADTNLGAVPASVTPGYLVLDGGGLRHNNGVSAITIHSSRGMTISPGGATFDSVGMGSWIYNGAVTGDGTITKTGTNVLVFGGNNINYNGKYVVLEGSIQSNNSARNGEAGLGPVFVEFVSDAITLDGGGIRVGPNTSTTIHENRGITLGDDGGSLVTAHDTNTITVNSVVSGTGALTKTGHTVAGVPFTNSLATLNAANTYSGGTIVEVGTLVAGHGSAFGTGTLTVEDGATARAQAGLAQPLTVGGVSTAGTGQVDLTNNRMIVSGGDLQAIHDLVVSGRGGAGATWDGPGINSSIAATNAGTHALGVRQVDDDVVVAYTFLGDANLDGAVNIADLGILAANWQQTGTLWSQGDFNYSGDVTIADLGILAANWQAGASGGSATMSFAQALAMFDVFDGVVVPEPASAALLAFGSLLLRRRRA
jgi:fibronectin-binding autotransporter adhesin